MPQRGTTNDILADRIGGGLAALFMPQDNTRRMAYLQGASQVAENNANIGRLNAQTALDTQLHGNRAAVNNPAAIQAAIGASPELAALFAPIMGTMTNADNGMQALLRGAGGVRMMAPGASEGDVRTGYALTGNDASLNNPLTGGGIEALFGQETALNDADNATEIRKTGITADAARFGHQLDYDAAIYGHDRDLEGERLHYGEGGASDRAAQIRASAPGSNKASEITPAEAKGIEEAILRALPMDTAVDGRALAQATAMAAQRTRETGDAAGAIAEVAQLFDVKPALREDGTPITGTTKAGETFPRKIGVFSRRPGAPQGEARKQTPMHLIDPSNAASMAATPPAPPLPKIPPAQWDAVLSQANAAIQAGADPAAVRQRLLDMGVQLQDAE
jgi:hypothetical protein